MGMSDYVRRLREKVGTDLLFMPSTHCVIRDAAGRLLLVRHVEGRWMLPGGAIEPGETPADASPASTAGRNTPSPTRTETAPGGS